MKTHRQYNNATLQMSEEPVYHDYASEGNLLDVMEGNRSSKVNSAFIDYNEKLRKENAQSAVAYNDTPVSGRAGYERGNSKQGGGEYQNDDPSSYPSKDKDEMYYESLKSSYKSGQNGQQTQTKQIIDCINLTYPIFLVSKLETQLQHASLKPHKQRQAREEVLQRLLKHDFNEHISAGMRVVSAMTHYLSLTDDLDGLYLFVHLVTELSKVLFSNSEIYLMDL